MTVYTTIYTHEFNIVSPNTSYLIPFPIKNKSDIRVFSGELKEYIFLNDDYTIIGDGIASETYATGTVTITDFTKLNTGDKVNLIETGITGLSFDFVCDYQSSAEGKWEATESNDKTAENLMNVINTTSGPSGTRFSATVDGNVVTAKQTQGGYLGNTTITLTDPLDGMDKTDFTGGRGGRNDFLLTLLDISPGGTYYVYRRTHKMQPTKVSGGTPISQMEPGYDLLALQAQEGMFATIDGFDAKGRLVKKIATPISDDDAANLGYVQSRMTSAGLSDEITPPISTIDGGSYLQADSLSSVKWGEARQLPGGINGYLRQDSTFLAAWQAEQTYHPPTIPTEPKWLSQSSSTMQWRNVIPLPSRTSIPSGATILSDGTDAYWSLQTDIPIGPQNNDSYDSAVRWVLTIVDGSLAWKAYVWGNIVTPTVGQKELLWHQTECQGHGGSAWTCESCIPGWTSGEGGIANYSTKVWLFQPHIGGYGGDFGNIKRSIYHGLHMPTEIIHGIAVSSHGTAAASQTDSYMPASSIKITETHIEFIRHEYMLHTDASSFASASMNIYWAVWSDSVETREGGGQCHV